MLKQWDANLNLLIVANFYLWQQLLKMWDGGTRTRSPEGHHSITVELLTSEIIFNTWEPGLALCVLRQCDANLAVLIVGSPTCTQVPLTPFICLRNPHAIHFIALGVYCTSCSLHYVCVHSIAPAVYCTAVYCTSYSSHCTNSTS